MSDQKGSDLKGSDRKVVIVGVGALGSHALLFLRNLPVKFTVIDFDRVEQKNLQSQFHTKMSLGKNKAAALQQAMLGLFGTKIDAVPHKLGDDNVAALLGGASLVLDCVDNLPTRLCIQQFVRAQAPAVPCLHGALSADGAYARLMWDPLFEGDAGGDGEATCEDGEHLPFVGQVGAAMAALVAEFVKDGRQRSIHLHPGGRLEVG